MVRLGKPWAVISFAANASTIAPMLPGALLGVASGGQVPAYFVPGVADEPPPHPQQSVKTPVARLSASRFIDGFLRGARPLSRRQSTVYVRLSHDERAWNPARCAGAELIDTGGSKSGKSSYMKNCSEMILPFSTS